jgi:hypothetical protein
MASMHVIFALITPAIVPVLLATVWFARGYTRTTVHDHEEIMENYVKPWFSMAFLPLITSLITAFVLWGTRRDHIHAEKIRYDDLSL